MSNIFLISDTHFAHKNVIKFEKAFRPFETIEEHDEALVDNWNKTVTKRDVIYHLGDVCWGKTLDIIGRLNGMKKLVRGNHDNFPSEMYLKYFTGIYGSVSLKGNLLTHIPIHPSEFYRWKHNIHGHLHSNVMTKRFLGFKRVDPRYICVSVEHTNLRPIAFDELMKDR